METLHSLLIISKEGESKTLDTPSFIAIAELSLAIHRTTAVEYLTADIR